MVGKIDLVMWTKNGAKTLPLVLKRINETIPKENINNRIIVDDQSTDSTRKIAQKFGWTVVFNEGKGISDGANTALRLVRTEFFASFEQDLILSHDWWNKIPKYLDDTEVGAASGMRFASQPLGVQKIQQYVAKKYRGEQKLSSWLRTRKNAAFTLGSTLDNTIYKTKIIRDIGGFPKIEVNAGVDTTLAYRIKKAGYSWIVDYNVQSEHLRSGLRQELAHQYWYGTQVHEIWQRIAKETNQTPPISQWGIIYRFAISPFTGLFMAYKTREATIAYIHPLIRFYYLKGYLEAGKYRLNL
jgi:glycosyltransferase involved in cell wall biosynthesis